MKNITNRRNNEIGDLTQRLQNIWKSESELKFGQLFSNLVQGGNYLNWEIDKWDDILDIFEDSLGY